MIVPRHHQSAGWGCPADRPAAATSTGVATGAAAGFQNSSSRAAARALLAARSALKSFDIKQAAMDILAVLTAALFVVTTAVSIIGSVFILLFVAL